MYDFNIVFKKLSGGMVSRWWCLSSPILKNETTAI